MIFRFHRRMKDIFPNLTNEETEDLEQHDRQLEDFISDKVGAWSDWIAWTPRMAQLEYDTATWQDAGYGDETDPDFPAVRAGLYRTSGPEVYARATILYGPGAQGTYNTGTTHTDRVIYLNLPTPCKEAFPSNPGSFGPTFNDALTEYAVGYTPLGAMVGTATWAQGGGALGYTGGHPILPPWSQVVSGYSFPDGPPADISSWCSAVTWDPTSTNDASGTGMSIWTWASSAGLTGPSPAPQGTDPSLSIKEGTLVTWSIRYFQA